MKLQINPKEFKKHFIEPIMDIEKEGKVSIYCDGSIVFGITSNKASSITLYNTYAPLYIEDPEQRISLNIMKLVKGLDCVGSEDLFISLDISPDICSFSTKNLKFNIRLLDNNLVAAPKFDREIFAKFPTHHEIAVDQDRVGNIKKSMDFSPTNGKFYLVQDGELVYFFFGDRSSTSNHTDDIQVLVAEDVKTSIPTKIYDVDILRMALRHRNNFSIKLNDNGVMYIEIENPNSNLKYITTPLIK